MWNDDCIRVKNDYISTKIAVTLFEADFLINIFFLINHDGERGLIGFKKIIIINKFYAHWFLNLRIFLNLS